MRSLGVFVNAPDVYFAAGANKMMFYGDPTNFGKPRRMVRTHARTRTPAPLACCAPRRPRPRHAPPIGYSTEFRAHSGNRF